MSVMCCFTVTFRRPPDLNIFFYDLILLDTLTNKTKSKDIPLINLRFI